MEGLCIFHGTAAHILWKNYTFSTETLPFSIEQLFILYGKAAYFLRKIPCTSIFYGSVMHLLRNSYTFSKEVLHIVYETRVHRDYKRIEWASREKSRDKLNKSNGGQI